MAGMLLVTDNLHELEQITITVQAMFGEVRPHILINAGLFGIGLREAVGK
jgi:hypothetical protein